MKYDTLNSYNYGGYTKMTAPSSNVYSTDEDESKRIIVHETLSHNYSAGVYKLWTTEKDISEYIIEQKDAEYKESSVTKEVQVILTFLNVVGIF